MFPFLIILHVTGLIERSDFCTLVDTHLGSSPLTHATKTVLDRGLVLAIATDGDSKSGEASELLGNIKRTVKDVRPGLRKMMCFVRTQSVECRTRKKLDLSTHDSFDGAYHLLYEFVSLSLLLSLRIQLTPLTQGEKSRYEEEDTLFFRDHK